MASQDTMIARRRTLSLLAAAVVGGVTWTVWSLHDAFLLAALVAAAGLLWSSRQWKAWIVATGFAAVGLYWSSIDSNQCSGWWRGRLVYEKLVGHLPYVEWSRIRSETLASCHSFYKAEDGLSASLELLEKKEVDGHHWERYQCPLGKLWISRPGKRLLAWLVWELTMQHDYESGGVTIRAGDTVVDCGAHVGTFARYALQRGAGRVIAIEPEPHTLAMLQANLADEIATGRVTIVPAGVWDQKTRLAISHSEENPAADSFVRNVSDSSKVEGLPVLPLDEIVDQLALDRVDFIKMDIEGAERRALAGARQTIARFKPRMAISSYHMHDDPAAIPAVVSRIDPGYRIYGKDFELGPRRLITKVLFFDPS